MAPKKEAPKKEAPKKDAAKKDAPKQSNKAAPKAANKKDQGKKAPAKPSKKGEQSKKGKKDEAALKKAAIAKAKAKARKEKDAALFVPRPKNFGVGQDLRPKHDVKRFVRWPMYVRRQRQKSVLLRRLKIPPAINQFNLVLDRLTKKHLFKFARKYKPESKLALKKRLRKDAEAKVKDPKAPATPKRPEFVRGLQRVTRLIERKVAKMVVIANDVEPLDLVLWMPTLCKKLGVPYCIVKGRAALGKLCDHKKTSCLAFTNIRSEDKQEFDKLVEAVKTKFNDKYEEAHRKWGGMRLGRKHKVHMARRVKATN